jgi:nicotinate-nucleotide adenylyltransferase
MATSTSDAAGRRRVGILGGSFNPPHLGHLIIASQAHHDLGLAGVVFVPAWSPPHKVIEDHVTAETRLRLATAAVDGDPRFSVSAVEIERRLRYSVETLAALSGELGDADLWFIVGSDSLLALATWKDPSGILERCRLAVAPRPGDDPRLIREHARRYDATVLDSPAVGLSSSDVRARVRRGAPLRYLVPEPVELLIDRLGLYRGAGGIGDAG